MLQQREAQRLQHADHPARMFAVGQGRLIRDQRQQAVQLHRIDAQPGGKAPEYAGAIIPRQMFGQRCI